MNYTFDHEHLRLDAREPERCAVCGAPEGRPHLEREHQRARDRGARLRQSRPPSTLQPLGSEIIRGGWV